MNTPEPTPANDHTLDLTILNNQLETGGDACPPSQEPIAPLLVALDAQPAETTSHPSVLLPGKGGIKIIDTAAKLGRAMSVSDFLYVKGKVLCELKEDHTLNPIKPDRLRSMAEEYADLAVIKTNPQGERIFEPAIISENTCKALLAAPQFLSRFREIRVLSRCPVLVPRLNGELAVVAGYDLQSKVLAFGAEPPMVSLAEAQRLLSDLLADYRFSTESDRSRAFASLLAPSLVHGGILEAMYGRAPLFCWEADLSQAGKGFFYRMVTRIFNHPSVAVSQKMRGVGSAEESLSGALIKGYIFVCLDNLRGKVNLPGLESLLTESHYTARMPYAQVEIDPRLVMLFATSNEAELTEDLANRSFFVRILKQPGGYVFKNYPEGDLLSHVTANQSLYLGAIFSLIQNWWAAGKRRTEETRHDFRAACQILDWIIQNLMGMAPLMDGHLDAKQRVSNSALSWLRKLAAAVIRLGYGGKRLRTNELVEICVQGDVEIPGVRPGTFFDEDDEESSEKRNACKWLGGRLRGCFRNSDQVTLDRMVITRMVEEEERPDHGLVDVKYYTFESLDSRQAPTPITPITSTAVESSPAAKLIVVQDDLREELAQA